MSYEESESEEGSEGEEGVDKAQAEDPLWALFSFIRYFKTNKGDPLAEPFLTLPSKRELPDYYESIKNPISLNIIRKNLKVTRLRLWHFSLYSWHKLHFYKKINRCKMFF